ncbi:hypothetical protein Pan258_02040 [Symmachiella dynata]|nr:hypothetical protein Pan258_02040 [Symmachiella dynata]
MLDNLSLSAFKKFVQEIRFPGIEYRLQQYNYEILDLKAEIAGLRQLVEDVRQENIRLVNQYFKMDDHVRKSLLEVRRELRAEFSQADDE